MKVAKAISEELVNSQLSLADEVMNLLDVMPAESRWFKELSGQMLMFLEQFDGYLDAEVSDAQALAVIEEEMTLLVGHARHLVHLAADTWRALNEA